MVFQGKSFGYTIIMNNSQIIQTVALDPLAPMSIHPFATPLKMLVDSALAYYRQHNLTYNNNTDLIPDYDIFNVTHQSFPHPENDIFNNYDVVTSNGALYFILPTLVAFMLFINEILKEKEKKLRQGLNVIGMSSAAYWVSWVIHVSLVSFVLSCSIVLFGWVFRLNFFVNSPLAITGMLFFFTTQAIYILAMFICSFASSMTQGFLIACAFVLVTIILELFISNPTVTILVYLNTTKWYFFLIKNLLPFYPPFNFSRVFGSIASQAGYNLDPNQRIWVKGAGYHWSNFTQPNDGSLPGPIFYSIPSDMVGIIWLAANSVIFLLALWYFDNVISSNKGYAKPFYFVISDPFKFFFGSRLSNRKNSRKSINAMRNSTICAANDPVREEREIVEQLMRDKEPCPGVRIFNLRKDYTISSKCGLVRKNVHALNGVSLELEDGELVAVLGHNGAGKTTMINIICGLLTPSQGEVVIKDYYLSQDVESIRSQLGICPQFDILWDDMTVNLRMLP